jgi:hypothetical protein
MADQKSPLLSHDDVRALLTELGQRLAAKNIDARIFIVGGSAMALAFDRSRVTRDIGAVYAPKEEVYREAKALAQDRGLPEDWLNNAAKGYAPSPPVIGESFEVPGLSVGVASAEYLFVMKARSARPGADRDDLKLLAREIGMTDPDQALGLIERYYGSTPMAPKPEFFVREVMAELATERKQQQQPNRRGVQGRDTKGRFGPSI